MKRLGLVLALALGCGRSAPAVDDGLRVFVAGPTTLTGELRTADDAAPSRGRLMVRDEDGAVLGVAACDAAGRFELELPHSGRIRFIAVDAEGNGARGGWLVQPNGVNDLGRVWLSTSSASPWLVDERDLGLEERLTAEPTGVLWTTAPAAGGPQFSDGLSVKQWSTATGAPRAVRDETAQAIGIASYFPYSYTNGWRLGPCWASTWLTDVANGRPSAFVIWDAARDRELARFPLLDRWVMRAWCTEDSLKWVTAEPGTTLADMRLAMRRIDRATGTDTLVGAVEVLREDPGPGQLMPPGMWLGTEAAVVKQRRYDLATGQYQYSTVYVDFAAQTVVTIPGYYTLSIASADGRRMLTRTYGSQRAVQLVDLPSGATRKLLDLASDGNVVFQSSPDQQWALIEIYSLTSRTFARVRFDTGAVEAVALPALPAELLATLTARIDDSGEVVGIAANDGQLAVSGLVGGWTSTFLDDDALHDAAAYWDVLLLPEGRLAVVARRLPTAASNWNWHTADAVIYTGVTGAPLSRRTFVAGAIGTVEYVAPYLYYPRRDALSGVPQLYRLELEPKR